MGKIATESYAASIGGGSTSTGNKCCTKSRAEALGCVVSGSYASNQLVQESDLSRKSYSRRVEVIVNKIGTASSYTCELTITKNSTNIKTSSDFNRTGDILVWIIPNEYCTLKFSVKFKKTGSINFVMAAAAQCKQNGATFSINNSITCQANTNQLVTLTYSYVDTLL